MHAVQHAANHTLCGAAMHQRTLPCKLCKTGVDVDKPHVVACSMHAYQLHAMPHMRLPSRCSQSSKHRHGTVWQPFALSASSVLRHHDKAKSSPTELVHADCHTQSGYKFGRGQSQAVKRFWDNGVKIYRATCHVSREDYYGAAVTWERHQ